MANANASTLTTNFNVTPYYDDYDETKEFYRILFRPGRAVQGRELTQMQTMLQKQIDRFGKHVFEEGSIVLPGTYCLFANNTSNGPVNYVKVKDVDDQAIDIDINDYLGETVVGQTNGIRAHISLVADGTETETNKKTIMVEYLSVADANANCKIFTADEVLVSNVGNLVVTSAATTPTGYGSAFSISAGVFFAKEHFIYFPSSVSSPRPL